MLVKSSFCTFLLQIYKYSFTKMLVISNIHGKLVLHEITYSFTYRFELNIYILKEPTCPLSDVLTRSYALVLLFVTLH